jgi:uncharacterized protein YaaQ
MKMIIVIVTDSDAEPVTRALTTNDFRVTRIASTGGFLRSGVVTLLIGVDDERVEAGIQVIHEHLGESDKQTSRATLFVVPVQRFEQV